MTWSYTWQAYNILWHMRAFMTETLFVDWESLIRLQRRRQRLDMILSDDGLDRWRTSPTTAWSVRSINAIGSTALHNGTICRDTSIVHILYRYTRTVCPSKITDSHLDAVVKYWQYLRHLSSMAIPTGLVKCALNVSTQAKDNSFADVNRYQNSMITANVIDNINGMSGDAFVDNSECHW